MYLDAVNIFLLARALTNIAGTVTALASFSVYQFISESNTRSWRTRTPPRLGLPLRAVKEHRVRLRPRLWLPDGCTDGRRRDHAAYSFMLLIYSSPSMHDPSFGRCCCGGIFSHTPLPVFHLFSHPIHFFLLSLKAPLYPGEPYANRRHFCPNSARR